MSGRAAFLAPEILIAPFSLWPPMILIRSKEHLAYIRENNVVKQCGEIVEI
jgi:hypothetical protein